MDDLALAGMDRRPCYPMDRSSTKGAPMSAEHPADRLLRLRCPLCEWVSTSAPRHKQAYLAVEYSEHIGVHHTPVAVVEWADA